MKMFLFGTMALSMALGVGAANAAASPPNYATSVPACISKSSPILDDHYGYDDRTCPTTMIEGRAASAENGSTRAQ
jgi:hypothetical protein